MSSAIESLHISTPMEKLITNAQYDLSHLQGEIKELKNQLPIKEIKDMVESGLSYEMLVDAAYNMVCDRNDFQSIMAKYHKQISYPMNNVRHRELFYYFFDHGYIFLGGDGHQTEFTSYTKREISHQKYPFLKELFGSINNQAISYYEITSIRRTEYGTCFIDIPIINIHTIEHIDLTKDLGYTLDSTILNEVTHKLVYEKLFVNGHYLETEWAEYLSDVVSSQLSVDYIIGKLIYSFIYRMFGESKMDSFSIMHYKITYERFFQIWEIFLRKYNQRDDFVQDYNNGVNKLKSNNPQQITYIDYTKNILYSEKYYSFLKDYGDEFKKMLIEDGLHIIDGYKDSIKD